MNATSAALPTFSVLMPNYNHGKYLRQALQAMVSQELPPTEFLIFDDGSTDDSRSIIEEFAAAHRFITPIFSERNLGATRAAALLLERSSCECVYGAAADDFVLPGFFSQSLALLGQHPEAALCSGLSAYVDEAGRPLAAWNSGIISDEPAYVAPARAARRIRTSGSWVMGNTTIYRRKILQQAGGFRPELHSFCDGFIQEVLAMRHGACFIPRILTCLRISPQSFSASFTADPANLRQLVETVVALMQSEYGDVYDEQAIARFRRVQGWNVRLAECQTAAARTPLRSRMLRAWLNFALRADHYAMNSPLDWPELLRNRIGSSRRIAREWRNFIAAWKQP